MSKSSISRKCSVNECENNSRSLGYCSKHYQRFFKHGDPNTNKTNKGVQANGNTNYQFSHTDSEGKIHIKATRSFDPSYDVDAALVLSEAQVDQSFIDDEVVDMIALFNEGIYQVVTPIHQTQSEFYRRVLGQIMTETNSHYLVPAHDFFQEMENHPLSG